MSKIYVKKFQKMKNQTLPGQLNGFQNVDMKVGHQHRSRTGMLDEIQNL